MSRSQSGVPAWHGGGRAFVLGCENRQAGPRVGVTHSVDAFLTGGQPPRDCGAELVVAHKREPALPLCAPLFPNACKPAVLADHHFRIPASFALLWRARQAGVMGLPVPAALLVLLLSLGRPGGSHGAALIRHSKGKSAVPLWRHVGQGHMCDKQQAQLTSFPGPCPPLQRSLSTAPGIMCSHLHVRLSNVRNCKACVPHCGPPAPAMSCPATDMPLHLLASAAAAGPRTFK